MKPILINFFLVFVLIFSGCSSDEGMEPEDENSAEIPAEFQESIGDGKVSSRGRLSGKIGDESFSADLKSVSFTDFQDTPGFTTQMVSLVGLVLKPDRDEMFFLTLIPYSSEILAEVDYKHAINANIVGLYGVEKDNYVSSLANQIELRFQKLDFSSGLASGSFNGSLVGFPGESNLSSDSFEITFEDIELVIVEE